MKKLFASAMLVASAMFSVQATAAEDQLLFNESGFEVYRDGDTSRCYLRHFGSDGTRMFYFLSDREVLVLSVTNPAWNFSTGEHTLKFEFPGSNEIHRWKGASVDPGEETRIVLAIDVASYAPLLADIRRRGEMLVIVDGRAVARLGLAGSSDAFATLKRCDDRLQFNYSGETNSDILQEMASLTSEVAEDIDQDLRILSQRWLVNRYDYGSVRNVEILDDRTGGIVRIRAEYTYNRGRRGWLIMESNGQSYCYRFWDRQNICQ